MSWPVLRAAIEATIARLAEVDASSAGPNVAWRRAGITFAELGPDGVAIRVGQPIAGAAVRTPDTRPSSRGPEWIEFRPPELDGQALDRLDAWLMAAHRRATA